MLPNQLLKELAEMRRMRQLASAEALLATTESAVATASDVATESGVVSKSAPSPEPVYLLENGANIGKEEAEKLRLKVKKDGRFGSFSGSGSATLETVRSRDGYGLFDATTEAAAEGGLVIEKNGRFASFRR